jgi:hypothetical protein
MITEDFAPTEEEKREKEREYMARYYKEHRGKLAKHPRQEAP